MVTAEMQLTRQEIDVLSNFQLELSVRFNEENGPRSLAFQIVNHLKKMAVAARDANNSSDADARKEFIRIGLNERNDALKKANTIAQKLDQILDYGQEKLKQVGDADHLLKVSLHSIINKNINELIKSVLRARDYLRMTGFLLKEDAINSYTRFKDEIFSEFNATSILISAVGTELAELKRSIR